MNVTIVGLGRAGSSFAIALRRSGHDVTLVHHDELATVPVSDLVLLTVPDDAIAVVAGSLPVRPGQVLAHSAGSRTLDVLAPHPLRASMHPLVTMPTAETGATRLIGATYCVAGDPRIFEIVESLGGRTITLRDGERTAYHATAAVAANHLVALMGHVERLADSAGLSLDDFLPLARQALADVAEFGPAAALTGPASRGDMATIDAHLAAIPESERSTYAAMANAAFELVEQRRLQLRA